MSTITLTSEQLARVATMSPADAKDWTAYYTDRNAEEARKRDVPASPKARQERAEVVARHLVGKLVSGL